jgi:hypothetical protein
MNSKRIFLIGWLGPTAFVAIAYYAKIQTLMLIPLLTTPFLLFYQWVFPICQPHFGPGEFAQLDQTCGGLAVALVSAYYAFTFLPYALPDRLVYHPMLRNAWAVLLLFFGGALGVLGIAMTIGSMAGGRVR